MFHGLYHYMTLVQRRHSSKQDVSGPSSAAVGPRTSVRCPTAADVGPLAGGCFLGGLLPLLNSLSLWGSGLCTLCIQCYHKNIELFNAVCQGVFFTDKASVVYAETLTHCRRRGLELLGPT